MNKAVLFLAALGASTALCAPVPAEKAEKKGYHSHCQGSGCSASLPGNAGRFYPEGG